VPEAYSERLYFDPGLAHGTSAHRGLAAMLGAFLVDLPFFVGISLTGRLDSWWHAPQLVEDMENGAAPGGVVSRARSADA
jgi:hypothetical protein